MYLRSEQKTKVAWALEESEVCEVSSLISGWRQRYFGIDERALRYAARMSSGRDLVEEFIGYGLWPLAHGWVVGEVCPRQMPTLGEQLVR